MTEFNKKYSITLSFDVISDKEIEDLLKDIKQRLAPAGKVVIIQDTRTTTWIDPATTQPQKYDENGVRVLE
jgi:hypothetical protein